MAQLDIERTAFTIECFLNTLRLADGKDRTGLEAILSRWLSSRGHRKGDFVLYDEQKVKCNSGGREFNSFEVLQAVQSNAVWTDGVDISIVDGEAFRAGKGIVKLGSAGLDFSMPEAVPADAAAEK